MTVLLSGRMPATRKRRNAGALRGVRTRMTKRKRIGAPVVTSRARIHGSDASVPAPSVCATDRT